MKVSKMKICKYPKCSKEVKSDTSLFCIEHSRDLRGKTKTATSVLGSVVILGLTAVAKKIFEEKA